MEIAILLVTLAIMALLYVRQVQIDRYHEKEMYEIHVMLMRVNDELTQMIRGLK